MVNEIPAGTKVMVVSTVKGQTVRTPAEVLAHMDGVVHVDMGGEAVSVHPDQIEFGDAPAPSQKTSTVSLTDEGLLEQTAFDHIIDVGAMTINYIESRITALENRVRVLEAPAQTISPEPSAAVMMMLRLNRLQKMPRRNPLLIKRRRVPLR